MKKNRSTTTSPSVTCRPMTLSESLQLIARAVHKLEERVTGPSSTTLAVDAAATAAATLGFIVRDLEAVRSRLEVPQSDPDDYCDSQRENSIDDFAGDDANQGSEGEP